MTQIPIQPSSPASRNDHQHPCQGSDSLPIASLLTCAVTPTALHNPLLARQHLHPNHRPHRIHTKAHTTKYFDRRSRLQRFLVNTWLRRLIRRSVRRCCRFRRPDTDRHCRRGGKDIPSDRSGTAKRLVGLERRDFDKVRDYGMWVEGGWKDGSDSRKRGERSAE